VIQTAHAPAYRLLEADFAERAKTADVFMYLELSAYFRHRRAAGRKLVQQIVPVLRKQPFDNGAPGEQQFFFDMWTLLTDYDTLHAAIADWQAGEESRRAGRGTKLLPFFFSAVRHAILAQYVRSTV